MSDNTAGDDLSTPSQPEGHRPFPWRRELMVDAVITAVVGGLALLVLRWLITSSVVEAILIILPLSVGFLIAQFFGYQFFQFFESRLKRFLLIISPVLIGGAISCMLFLSAVASIPRTAYEFELRTLSDPNSILLKYTGTKPLTDVELLISLRLVNGERLEIKRFWATWKTDESKTVPVEFPTPVEKWELHGRAMTERRPTTI